MPTHSPERRRVLLLTAAGLLLAAQLPAQEEEAVRLDELRVEEVPIEENILPTSRPFNSVFGTDQSILETPRNVTIISREQLSAISIQDVRDFSKLTSSSFTRSNFGAPSNPDIRGQYGDLFVNGMRARITSNGNGLPIDFNAVESVNIVKGPATAVQGASFYVGGFVDLITKRPYFDGFRGTVGATVGSYNTYRWTLDFGGPVSDVLAYRVSYAGEDSEGYFYDGERKTHSLYAALTWRPSDTYELFVNAQIYNALYTENFGVNRPTPNLIENGLYTTGVNNNPAPVNGGYVDANGNAIGFGNPNTPAGPAAPQSDPQNSRWVTSGFPVANRMAFGPEVPFDRRARLLRPGDNSVGNNITLQAIQTAEVSPEFTLVNNSLFTYTVRDTFSSYHYSEIIDPSWAFENRTEFRFTTDSHTLNTGVALRYQYVEAFNHFFFEPAAVWDLTRDRSFINVYNSVNWPDASPVPGWEGRFATPGVFNGDTNESEALSFSPFIQEQWKATDNLTLIAGGRIDFLSVEGNDPLKPPFIASADDDISLGIPNVNASVLYSITPTLTAYVTYNYSQNYSGAVANGGGFGQLSDPDGDGTYTFDIANFRQKSELYEAGAKASLLDGTLFVGGAVFAQSRSTRSSGASGSVINRFKYRGVEVEGNFQPSRNFLATLSYSYIHARQPGPGFDVANISPFLPGYVPNFFLPPGERGVQGMPNNLINGLVQYTFDNGFGASLSGLWHSEINNNIAGTLVIPSQVEFDATLFYERGPWGLRLALLNVTDEKNWSPPNAVYGNESIVAEEGFRAELTVTYDF